MYPYEISLAPQVFHHRLNITVGKGRVLYADALPVSRSHPLGVDAGWVLPGGERTHEHARALAVAAGINRASA